MSTSSVVAIPLDNGFTGRYVHCDGHPSHQVRHLLVIIARDGVHVARHVLTQENRDWSSLNTAAVLDPGGPVREGRDVCEGYGMPNVGSPDEWWTRRDVPRSMIEWVYVLGDTGITVLRPGEHDVERVGFFAYGSTPTDEQVAAVECGASSPGSP